MYCNSEISDEDSCKRVQIFLCLNKHSEFLFPAFIIRLSVYYDVNDPDETSYYLWFSVFAHLQAEFPCHNLFQLIRIVKRGF